MKTWIRSHKKISITLAIIIAIGAYLIITRTNADEGETRYVLAAAERGTVIAAVTGSGQVSSSNEVELSPKASGEVLGVYVKAGQVVSQGAVIARLDSGDAAYDLESAQLSYNELVSVDPDDLRKAQDTVQDAQESIEDAYTDARTTLTNQSTDMADTLEDIHTLLNGYLNASKGSRSTTERTMIVKAEDSYYEADEALSDFTKQYRTVSTNTDQKVLETMVRDGYDLATKISQAAKYTQDAVVYARDHEEGSGSAADTAYGTVRTIVNTANGIVTSFSSVRSAITNATQSLTDAQSNLDDIESGPDTLDLRAEELSLRQKREALANYTVRAPFAGVIASVAVTVGDTINSGTSVVTLITKEKIAEVSLNEIDAAKVIVGQRATLTFDAVEDLTITGQVAEIDLIGTVTQGVVSYKVKIGFDTDDDRVKPGMTTSATITTESKTDVVMVPASAIKTQGTTTYIETAEGVDASTVSSQGILLATAPQRVEVSVGLAGDDFVEILSGLVEGDTYIARTIKANALSATTASAPSLFGGGTTRQTGGFGGTMAR